MVDVVSFSYEYCIKEKERSIVENGKWHGVNAVTVMLQHDENVELIAAPVKEIIFAMGNGGGALTTLHVLMVLLLSITVVVGGCVLPPSEPSFAVLAQQVVESGRPL